MFSRIVDENVYCFLNIHVIEHDVELNPADAFLDFILHELELVLFVVDELELGHQLPPVLEHALVGHQQLTAILGTHDAPQQHHKLGIVQQVLWNDKARSVLWIALYM